MNVEAVGAFYYDIANKKKRRCFEIMKGVYTMKKFLAILLVLLFSVGGALAEFPLTTTGESLHIMVNNSSLQPDFNQVKMWQKYAEMTGVNIEWENIPQCFPRI